MTAFLTVAIDMLGFGIVVPLLPRYAERFQHEVPAGLQGLVIGLLMASFSLVQFFFAPIWGRLSDRVGRRPVLLIGLSGSVVAYLMFAWAGQIGSLALLFAARIGQGLCGATISTAQAVIADCTRPEERARGMALIGLAFGVGFTFGPVIGALAVSGDPKALSPAPGLAAAGICLVGFLFGFFRMPETLRPGSGSAARRIFDLDGFRHAFSTPAVLLPIATFFVALVAFGQLEGTLARMTQDVLGFTDAQNFWTFFYIGLVLMVAQGLVVRQLVHRVGEVRLVQAGAASMLLGMATLGLGAQFASFPLSFFGITFSVLGFSSLTGPTTSLVSRNADPKRQGEILGVAQSCGAVARIVGPLLGNVIYGGSAGARHALPYALSAALLAGALAFAFRLRAPAPFAGAEPPPALELE